MSVLFSSQTLHNKVTSVRPASTDDTPALVALALAFIRESSYRASVPENPERLAATVGYLIALDTATILVAECDGTVVGMIALAITPHLFSAVPTAGELAWYVLPAHRGTAGLRLLRAAEDWARTAGAEVLHMIAPTPEVGQLYTRLGFTALETNYQKRLGD